jgi:hypothetical protein
LCCAKLYCFIAVKNRLARIYQPVLPGQLVICFDQMSVFLRRADSQKAVNNFILRMQIGCKKKTEYCKNVSHQVRIGSLR